MGGGGVVRRLNSSRRNISGSWGELLGFLKKRDWVCGHGACPSAFLFPSPFSRLDQDPWPCWDLEATLRIKPQRKNKKQNVNKTWSQSSLGSCYISPQTASRVLILLEKAKPWFGEASVLSLCYLRLNTIHQEGCLPKMLMLVTPTFNPGSAASLLFHVLSALLPLTHWWIIYENKIVTVSISDLNKQIRKQNRRELALGRVNLWCPKTAQLFGVYNVHRVPAQLHVWGWRRGQRKKVSKETV